MLPICVRVSFACFGVWMGLMLVADVLLLSLLRLRNGLLYDWRVGGFL